MQPPDLLIESHLNSVIDPAPLTATPRMVVMQAIAFMHRSSSCSCELLSPEASLRWPPALTPLPGSANQQIHNQQIHNQQRNGATLPHPPSSQPHSCILVVEGSQLVGIFTERDVVRLVASGVDLAQVTLAEVMTQPVITLSYPDSQALSTSLSLMRQHQIRHLPLVDAQGQLVGLVTQMGLLQAYDRAPVSEPLSACERSQDFGTNEQSETDLQELRVALQNAIEGISHLDQDGKYLLVNRTYAELCGYEPDEMIGMDWQVTVHPEDLPDLNSAYQQMLDTGKVEVEARGIRKDGSLFYKQLTMVTTYNNQGNFTGHYCFLKDISDRKQAEASLQQQLEQERLVTAIAQRIRRSLNLDEILNTTVEEVRQLLQPDRVIILRFEPDWKGTIVAEAVHDAWPSILSMTVYDPCFSDSYTAAYRQGRITTNSDIYTAGLSQCHIDLLVHFQVRANLVVPILQGETLWGLVIAQQCATPREWQPFEIELLKQLALQLGIAIQQADLYCQIQVELMERQRVEEALRVSETLYRDLVELQTDLIIRIDLQGHLTFANSAATEMFGVHAHKVRGKSLLQFVHPDDLPDVMANLQALTTPPYQLITGEQRAFTVNGLRWFQWNVAAIKDYQGQVVEIQGVGRDITDRKQVEEALRQSEQRFRRLVESNLFGVVFANFKGVIHYANDAFLTMVGYDREDLRKGRIHWDQLTPPEFAPLDERVIQELQTQGVATPFEKAYIRKDGSQVPILLGAALLEQPYDQQQEAVAFCLDLTERKQAEAALLESEKRWQFALEGSGDGVWDWNIPTSEVFFSRRWQEMLGFEEDEIEHDLGEWDSRIHPDDKEKVYQELDKHLRGETTHYMSEHRIRCKDGTYKWILDRGQVMSRTDTGQPLRLIGTYTDISDRKQTEQKIYEQAELLDITSDAIFVRDRSNHITFWSKGAEQLYGWTAAEALGKNATDLLFKQNSSQMHTIVDTVFAQGEWRGELQRITQTGKEVIVSSRLTLIRDETGLPKSILTVDTDITEKKQLERQFLRAQRIESIGTLSSGIAHDLNNILTPMLTAAQLLPIKFPNADERTQQLLRMLETNAKRGAELVKQVVLFVRGVEGKHTPLEMGHLLTEIEQIVQQTFPKAIALAVDSPPDLWQICGDITQLHQVLMNLCINARDAMPEGGILKLKAKNLWMTPGDTWLEPEAQTGAYVMVTIADTGMGISPDIIDKIFEPFFTTKEHGKGTGLGLSTVVGILKSHQGFVNVSSKVGQGTEFRVFLPAVETTIMQAETGVETSSGQGELILVVDDEAAIRETTQEFLVSKQYQVLTAGDGPEAIALYTQYRNTIQLVITDMMMPFMSGQSTIQTLRTLNPELKIIAFSGLIANEKIALAAGVDAFLAKPFSPKELVDIVHKVLTTKF